jgi:hypothetical protein
MDRRDFLRHSGAWALGTMLGAVAESVARASEWTFQGFSRPALPGACLPAGSDVEKTLAAILDTVVPGPSSDPDGSPGAVEACAMNLLLDDFFPFRQYAGFFAGMADQLANDAHAVPFASLPLPQRVEVLVQAQEMLPLLRLAFRAIRSAFFGGAYNGVGFDYVGYPGPNLGWRHVELCSFRRAVCRERTTTGWMP